MTIARSIDHTLLKPDATREEILKLCAASCVLLINDKRPLSDIFVVKPLSLFLFLCPAVLYMVNNQLIFHAIPMVQTHHH